MAIDHCGARIENSATIAVPGSKWLASGEHSPIELPSTIQLPDGFSLTLQSTKSQQSIALESSQLGIGEGWEQSISALGVTPFRFPTRDSKESRFTLTQLSMQGGGTEKTKTEMEVVLNWLEQVAAAMQQPVSSVDFFSGIARAAATLSELSAFVLKSDGVLVDYVGDEMFAMWGAPESAPDDALRSVLAAREMMALRKELSERYKDCIPGGVDFGIGICTGPARVGNTGSKQKFKYGPMGRTVNLGSRIQGLTKHWKVSALMDAETANSLLLGLLRRRLCKAKVVGLDGELDLFE